MKLSRAQLELLTHQVTQHFEDELQQDIGQFEAEFLIEFFCDKIGPHYYNKGLSDASVTVSQRAELIVEAIEELTQADALAD
ncbi:DUF2164 domain-containing protein [Motilimonas pumila]|uniref:DUF2164 domain-containing protein n=1 Tax=Motilimonas pumila TaxID=2303987 RepID=A0A418YI93_9GAMM|nr:DUF2164 domain-containing protein [Motilimonas pumila]RJG49941.1 DUF2164 domain-containing protein [Motilimonas pumila]